MAIANTTIYVSDTAPNITQPGHLDISDMHVCGKVVVDFNDVTTGQWTAGQWPMVICQIIKCRQMMNGRYIILEGFYDRLFSFQEVQIFTGSYIFVTQIMPSTDSYSMHVCLNGNANPFFTIIIM